MLGFQKGRGPCLGGSVDCGSMLEPLFMEATTQASVFQYCSLDGQSRMGP